jgi:hypothetical protein
MLINARVEKKRPTTELKTLGNQIVAGGGMDAACNQLGSFCKAKTASLKTAGMRFLSTTVNSQQSTVNRQIIHTT